MSAQPLTIVVRTYNSQRRLEETLQTIAHQDDKHFSIVFMDKGSQDQTEQFCREAFPKSHFIQSIPSKPWVESIEETVKQPLGLTLVINDDVRLPVNLVSTARQHFEHNQYLAVLSPALYDEKLNMAYASCRDGLNFVGTIVHGLSNREGRCFTINPSVFFIDLSKVRVLPFFTVFDQYFAYALCWQSWLQGYEAHCLIDSIIRDFNPKLLAGDALECELQRLTVFNVLFDKETQQKLKPLYWLGSGYSRSFKKECHQWECDNRKRLEALFEKAQEMRRKDDDQMLHQMSRRLASQRDWKSKVINNYSKWWCRIHNIETLEDALTCV